MDGIEILTALKVDLQISTPALDEYLGQLIDAASGYIAEEGVSLGADTADGMLVEMYAAWLYRRRREENAAMPRMLRWALNNRLMRETGGAADG